MLLFNQNLREEYQVSFTFNGEFAEWQWHQESCVFDLKSHLLMVGDTFVPPPQG